MAGATGVAEKLTAWRRTLATRSASERWPLFRKAAEDMASLPWKDGGRGEIADALAELAQAHGWHISPGDDAVQAVIAEAFAQNTTLLDDDLGDELHKANGQGEPLVAVALGRAFAASEFEGVAVPVRRWLVEGRIPMRNVTLLAGDGATGKTTIALQLAVVCAAGRNDWLGAIIAEPGPVLFVTAEEEREEVHFRLEAVRTHYVVDFAALDQLHIHCAAGEDYVLAQVSKLGAFVETARYAQLRELMNVIRPKLLVLESSADFYGGNENDRAAVRQFIRLLRSIAVSFDCAVVLISHPSLAGIATGTGTSGSTGWNNAVRSRLYFSYEDEQESGDFRVLKVMKANYAARGETVRLKYSKGVFAPEAGAADYGKRDAQHEAVFLDLLRRFHRDGRGRLSPHPSSTYAPALFAEETEAKRAKLTRHELGKAMARLFEAKKIRVEVSGPASKRRETIVEASNAPSNVLDFPSNPFQP